MNSHNYLVCLVVVALTFAACGTDERPEYVGQFAGDGAVVFLDQVDDELFYVNLELGGSAFGVSADYVDGSLSGSLDDFGQHPFSIAAQPGGGIELTVGGQSYRLRRAGEGGAQVEVGIADSETAEGLSGGQAAGAGAAGDPRLVGSYSRQEMISTPNGVIATQIFLEIRSNGTFSEAMGETLGGGMEWSGQLGGGGVQTAEWTAQNGVFLVRPPGTGQWVPLARYVLEPGRLMFVYDDGSRHLWYRR